MVLQIAKELLVFSDYRLIEFTKRFRLQPTPIHATTIDTTEPDNVSGIFQAALLMPGRPVKNISVFGP